MTAAAVYLNHGYMLIKPQPMLSVSVSIVYLKKEQLNDVQEIAEIAVQVVEVLTAGKLHVHGGICILVT